METILSMSLTGLLKAYFTKVLSYFRKPKSLMLWDIENISVLHYDTIMEHVGFKPNRCIAIAKRPFSKRERAFFKTHAIEAMPAPKDADSTIIEMSRVLQKDFEILVLASSDSDFVRLIRRWLDDNKTVYVFTKVFNNFRLLVDLPLTHERLKTISYFNHNRQKPKKQSIQNQPKRAIDTQKYGTLTLKSFQSRYVERYDSKVFYQDSQEPFNKIAI